MRSHLHRESQVAIGRSLVLRVKSDILTRDLWLGLSGVTGAFYRAAWNADAVLVIRILSVCLSNA